MGLLLLLHACAALPAEAAAPAAGGEAFTGGPWLQKPGKTHMTVVWTSDLAAGGLVRYGRGGALKKQVEVKPTVFDYLKVRPRRGPMPANDAKACVYKAHLVDLKPGTDYRYEVTCAGKKKQGSFRTFPEKPESFTFVAYGDNRSAPREHREVASAFAKHKPAFVLHNGDMVNNDHYPDYREFFFDPLAGIAERLPILTARGNHEGDGVYYRHVTALPGKEAYYSFDYANVHFVCLDSNFHRRVAQKHKTPVMLEWCRKDLAASRADWKVVYMHEPIYDLGWRRTAWGRQKLLPILREHGVDLVISGHSHCYLRFRPMFWPGRNEKHPITHIVTAGGGAPRTIPFDAKPHLAASYSRTHYTLFSVDGGTLTARALKPDGTKIDSFKIVKKAGKLDGAYLAGALSEEAFGALERSVSVVRLRGIPKKGQPFTVKMTLRGGRKPVKFEVRVAEVSRKYLDLVAPVTGTIPAGRPAEVAVSAVSKVRIKKRNRGRTSPWVVFAIHYEVDGKKYMIECNWATWK